MWRLLSGIAGADMAWGMADSLARLMGASPVDVEGPEAVELDVPADVR